MIARQSWKGPCTMVLVYFRQSLALRAHAASRSRSSVKVTSVQALHQSNQESFTSPLTFWGSVSSFMAWGDRAGWFWSAFGCCYQWYLHRQSTPKLSEET